MKFPRSEDDARKLTVEVAAHPVIADRLGELVPAILGVAEPSDRFPFPSVAYIRARGRQGQTIEGPIIQPKAWARTTLARELAQALTTLHTTPLKAVKAAGIAAHPVVLDPQVDVGEDAIAWARRVAGDAVDAFLSDPLPMEARSAAAGVLCHAALKGEHLFVSEDGTRLTAIVDWADARSPIRPPTSQGSRSGWVRRSCARSSGATTAPRTRAPTTAPCSWRGPACWGSWMHSWPAPRTASGGDARRSAARGLPGRGSPPADSPLRTSARTAGVPSAPPWCPPPCSVRTGSSRNSAALSLTSVGAAPIL